MFDLQRSTFNVQRSIADTWCGNLRKHVERWTWSVERYPQWELSGVFLLI